MTPSLTESQAFAALRTFLLAVLPAGVECVRGQANRVPMPAGQFVVITPTRRQQMAQNAHAYDPTAQTETIERSTRFDVQIDVYGDASPENAQVITTLLRDEYGATALRPSGVSPLYCSDPMQMPLIAGEQQYIDRWTMTAALHSNVGVTVPMGFANTLITTLTEIQ
jgi:hypothetical protein